MEDIMKKRHSLSHALAAAVLELYPDAKPTIGPATDTGFYYDFDFGNNAGQNVTNEEKVEDKRPSEKDLPKIEKKMRAILSSWDTFNKKEVSVKEATDFFKDNQYKKELIEGIQESGETITLYTSGSFTDLCRGGHVDTAKAISPDSFKLSSIAGAYWRGDEKNTMLTRIYGIAFDTKDELDAHLVQQEEALKRDHRKLGRELDLFTFSELVGSGLPLFTPRGTAMRQAIINRIYDIQKRFHYEEVWIPHITKKELYMTSGHWDKFGEELFKVTGRESEFVLKPMNCPHHTQIFASRPRSYKELPVRFTEATTVYRDEQGGELLGLSRVRSITQDDGHIFCTPEQMRDEILAIISIIGDFYKGLGMFEKGAFRTTLSVRDPEHKDKYLGSDDIWKLAENTLTEIAESERLPYTIEEGEAAFYGPKLDFKFKDAIGREWQLATVQLDFAMPDRFGLEYTDKDGTRKTPVMIHRAIAGALERFLSVIIEHFAGNFPLWLAPEQVRIIPIDTEKHIDFAQEVYILLSQKNMRVTLDTNKDSFGKRVRSAKDLKVSYFVIIGDAELENKKITVESRDKGKVGEMEPNAFLDSLLEEIDFKN